MLWVYYLVLLVVGVLGLALNVLGLPGIWLIVAATGVYAWLVGGSYLLWCLGVLILLGITAEIAESAFGGVEAKKAGGSKRGIVGAILGGLAGGLIGTVVIPVPVIGTVIGACVGSFVGAFAVEMVWLKKNAGDSWRIGLGAAKGRLYGTVIKLLFGAVMFLVSAVWALPVFAPQAASVPAVALPATMPASTAPASMGATTQAAP